MKKITSSLLTSIYLSLQNLALETRQGSELHWIHRGVAFFKLCVLWNDTHFSPFSSSSHTTDVTYLWGQIHWLKVTNSFHPWQMNCGRKMLTEIRDSLCQMFFSIIVYLFFLFCFFWICGSHQFQCIFIYRTKFLFIEEKSMSVVKILKRGC